MKMDSLGRRLRSAPPFPKVKRLVLTEPDYLLFDVIDRHGPLPSHYLYEFTKHFRHDRTHLQNRLTEFYNGDAGGPYLVRPTQQFASYRARYQHVVYDLAARARRVLSERDPITFRARTDSFLHRLMCACVSASIELAAREHGLRYIDTSEILARPGCVVAKSPRPLQLPLASEGQAGLEPDILFGLEYPGIGFRFFAVEIDRQTESIERRNLRQSAFARKLEAYVAALQHKTYRAWWSVPNLQVLIVTTNATHGRNILTFVGDRIAPAFHEKFALATAQSFGADWSVPSTPQSNLLTEPWATPRGTLRIGIGSVVRARPNAYNQIRAGSGNAARD